MKFLLLGATGTTGLQFIDQALAAGHEVVAMVRNPEKLQVRRGLHVVVGDVLNANALAAAAQGVDAIVSTLGVRNPRSPNDFILNATRALIAAAKHAGIRRVLLMSAFGVGASYKKASWIIRLGYHVAATMFRDKEVGEEVLMSSDLDWTIAYPGVLTNGTHSGNFTTTDLNKLKGVPWLPRIARADVADFLLTAASNDTWNKHIVVIIGK